MSPASIDQAIAALAADQHGVVERLQLIRLGIHPRAIDRRLATGRLHRIHAGVYAVGHPHLTPDGRRMAAVLACGPQAVISHATAAELHGIRPSAAGRIDITVRRSQTQRHTGVFAHRPVAIDDDEVTAVRGIPVTTVERTLIDLAGAVNRRQLERACDAAERQRTVDWRVVGVLLDRRPHRTGARRLAACLAAHGMTVAPRTRSGLEEAVLALCARQGIPAPDTNGTVEGLEVDFAWPEARLVVEADGHGFHSTPFARERDRRRDAHLTAAGWRVMRVSDARLQAEPGAVARDLRAALGLRSA